MQTRVIGLVYDLLGTHPRRDGDPPDADAEYEPESTVATLEAAIARLGHRSRRIGNPHALLAGAGKGELPALDAALCIAEGYGSRNREAWAPILLDMLGIPALGSDALTLSLSLDKLWTKNVVAAAGVPVAPHAVARSAAAVRELALPAPFPLFVKPRWEGTAKGIGLSSRVEDRAALEREVARVVERYRQPALIEAFVGGPEYTVTVVGNDPPRALPVLQRALEASSRIGLHALESATPPAAGFDHCVPGTLEPALEDALVGLALRAYDALCCLDFARADFRIDADGRPRFLEINPLPTFARDGSFGVLAELAGRPLEALLAEVFEAGLRRLGLAP
ncbi:MAG: D-alanine--D-alanine ligase [Deltaproteobacteria bacterium]|nr:MAG: D-alanine--D-alanine ligase [Deltaproteobacteria bacterium]